jgi:hypothetical protein
MKKITQRQTDKLFIGSASDLYNRFVENAVVLYTDLFPEKCTSALFDDAYYDMVRQRLMLEISILYNEAKGEKNAKKKCKVAAKRTVAN